MDITPDPRALKMLGEIEFEEWQCLAELIDNSFDSFLKLEKLGEAPSPGGWQVTVDLPEVGQPDGIVRISDNGPGMSREQLNNAVKAGFSSNDKHANLGLFGMGFNVSTARLGGVTSISTQQSSQPHVAKVTIDFNQLTQNKNFEALEEMDTKEYPSDHGTTIEISSLKPERAEYLSRNSVSISQKLGMTYSHLIVTKGFKLFVQGLEVKPHRHCVWSSERAVSASGDEKIPAVMKIDKALTPVLTCRQCGEERLYEQAASPCPDCNSLESDVLERRIYGWIGVQRYLHPSEFGIDFLRNGRKIMTWDKKLFSWRNPNDPSSTDEIEYPSELAHQGGRIVGEIHIDHVPVSYTKDNFEYSDKGWKFMVEYMRGTGPIRPNKAKQAGFALNESPLARLINAYKLNKPGTKDLMPGDGNQAIHVTTREWGTKFRQGEAEYQSDDKWWEAAEQHDQIKQNIENSDGGVEDVGDIDIWAEIPLPPKDPDTVTDVISPPKTVEEQTQEMILASSREAGMSRNYDLGGGKKISIEVFSTLASKLPDNTFGSSPVQIKVRSGSSYACFFNGESIEFKNLGFDPEQMILSKLSQVLSQRYNMTEEEVSLTIAKQIFGNLGSNPGELKEDVSDLLRKIISEYALTNAHQASKVITRLEKSDEQTLIDSYSTRNGGKIPDLGKEDGLLEYLPVTLMAHLFEVFPESFLNGKVFSFTLEPAMSAASKRKIKWGILHQLLPLVAFMESTDVTSASELRSLRKNLNFVRKQIG
jgi:hypothetical protein